MQYKEKTYFYFPIKSTAPKDDKGVTIIGGLKKGNKFREASFAFNLDFGGAIEILTSKTATPELGTSDIPYQIRSEEQLRNITKRREYASKTFNQTCGFDVSKGLPLELTFSGKYNATHLHTNCPNNGSIYNITGNTKEQLFDNSSDGNVIARINGTPVNK